jgi:negative elongation factor B
MSTSVPTKGKGKGFGLEEIGIPGRDYLREALTNCSDPLKAIEEFQVLFKFIALKKQ